MKKLHEFTVNKLQEVEEVQVQTDAEGKEIKVLNKISKWIPHKYCIRKPGRQLQEQGELFHGVTLADGIKAGLLTQSLLAKRFANDGGVYSEDEKKEYLSARLKLSELELELQKLFLTKEPTEDETARRAEVIKEIAVQQDIVQMYNFNLLSLFNQTAETRARNKTVFWWLLHLSYKVEGDKEIPFFDGETYEQKLKSYDAFEDTDDKFINETINTFIFYITKWYLGIVSSPEDFVKLDKERADTGESAGTENEAKLPSV